MTSPSSDIRKRAMAMLDRRQMSRAQLVKKLCERGSEEREAEETADWLCEIGALNDEFYARDLMRHYANRGYGAKRIKQELFRRGVDRETSDSVLSELELPEQAIDRLVSAKLKGAQPDRNELKRLYDALLRRGFSYGEIRDALSRYSIMLEDEDFG